MSGAKRRPFAFGRIGPRAGSGHSDGTEASLAARRPAKSSASKREVIAQRLGEVAPDRDQAAKSKIVSALRKLHPME